ncbi:hypothetical protein EP47_09480 [Legionella norrlandica]|uniref:Uncharacterized protein n=1 Tax=Legionella norrlandica TaxID=1498499 RepID=A0A0A2SVK7_9GAMM|nr:hypothetical protein [Legionella norrlandica]KGP63434.1 hypothetical protein EP47_09480 [Legionella norrlandica]
MPPKNRKELLDVIDNLDKFSEKLLNRIADESEEGCKQLILVIEAAKARYNKPIESWLKGWFYQYTRKRGQDIELAIKSIEAFPDAYTRLQEFKLLVAKGEWEHGSFNYYLFDELIKSVPGYKFLESELVQPIILKLREKIGTRINEFMSQYHATQKLIEAQKQELKITQQSAQKFVDNVLIANNLESAKTSAEENKNYIQFGLISKNNVWKLFWVDATGKVYALELGEELMKILIEHNVKEVENISSLRLKRLKKECLKARESFLERTQLIINPLDPKNNINLTNEELIQNGLAAAFVLRGKPNDFSLWWINTLGFAQPITLDSYPSLALWLNAQNYPFGEEQILQLKAHLLNVNTSKSIGMGEFKAQLQECLVNGFKNAKVEQTSTSSVTTPKKLDLSLFVNIERCLSGKLSKMQEEKLNAKDQESSQAGSNNSDITQNKSPERTPCRLDLKKYGNIETFFLSRAKIVGTEESLKPAVPTI